MRLRDDVRAFIARHDLIRPGAGVVVGVSGGADSLVLLHALAGLGAEAGWALHVATLDHGLRGEAGAADAAFVRDTAREWGLPVTRGRADVLAAAEAHGLGVEEAARQVRYTFLLRVARQVGAAVIAVGHNRDDQAETVLMHLIRGSGLSGLRGMLPATPLSTYHLLPDIAIATDPPLDERAAREDSWPALVRPLLGTPRAAIEAYAADHGLHPRQDATNQDQTYFRNQLRHTVLPLLESLNPNIRATLARTAEALRADADRVYALGEAALARALRAERPGSVLLDRAVWAGLTLSEKRHIVRTLAYRLRPALRDVSLEHVEGAVRLIDAGRPGTAATLPGGLEVRVEREVFSLGAAGEDVLAVVPGEDAPALAPGSSGATFLPGESVRQVYGGWVFEARPARAGEDLDAAHADPLAAALRVPVDGWLKLRTREPGDRFRPRGMGGHSQKLSDTFNAMQVPQGWRDRAPLLAVDGEIVWFVAPSGDGLRGRVSEPAGELEGATERATVVVIVGWRRLESINL